MAPGRARSVYVCQQCGHQEPRWMGRCPDCGAWGSLAVEQAAPVGSREARVADEAAIRPPVPLTQVEAAAVDRQERAKSYFEIQDILTRDVPYWWLVETDFFKANKIEYHDLAIWSGNLAERAWWEKGQRR